MLEGDDAIGPTVVRVFEARYAVPEDVTVIDGGTPGLDLTAYMMGLEGLVVIDAIKSSGGVAGEVKVYDKKGILNRGPMVALSPHEPGCASRSSTPSSRASPPRSSTWSAWWPARSSSAAGSPPRSAAPSTAPSRRCGWRWPAWAWRRRSASRRSSPTSGGRSRRPRDARRPPASGPVTGRRLGVTGTVQGVGMRPFVWRAARDCGVGGRVRNDAAGVTVEAFGTAAALDAFGARLRADGHLPRGVASSRAEEIAPEATGRLRDRGERRRRRAARRHPPRPRHLRRLPARGASTRPTVAFAIRSRTAPTAGRASPSCAACPTTGPPPPWRPSACARTARAEYARPARPALPRRAQRLPGLRPARRAPRRAPARRWPARPGGASPARRSPAGRILAVKGIGGYHLACDATSPAAVADAAGAQAARGEAARGDGGRPRRGGARWPTLEPAERELLASAERPVVLCAGARERRSRRRSPPTPPVGLLLPYSPLHHLLLAAAGRPLVMTSGNLSEEPIAYRDDDALARLGGIADLFLVHDREIEARADDSVARVVVGRPLVMRRARGFVPLAGAGGAPFPRPVLACGAQLKNAFCLAAGDEATLGPHVGDLENLETSARFEESVARLERFLRLRPALLAHDLHPDYLSTRYARERPPRGHPAVAVQHHHAHAAAAMAEHGLDGPALALTWDGTGLGTDGAAWGGELLLARYERLRAAGHVPPRRRCPAATGPSGSPGGSRWWRSTRPSTAGPARRLPLFARGAGRRAGGGAAHGGRRA